MDAQLFAENLGRRRQDVVRNEIEASDWLALYYEQFRGIALDPRPDAPAPHVLPPAASASDSLSTGARLCCNAKGTV